MLDFGDRNLQEIASNPSSSPSLLTELSNHSDKEIRFLVASNPNTPPDILMQLGEEFPDEIIENPIFNLLTIEEPNSRFVHLSLARSTKTAPEVLTKLAAIEKEDQKICLAIAKNINTPPDTLKSLVDWDKIQRNDDCPYAEVGRAVLNNSHTPISYLEELLDECARRCLRMFQGEFSTLPNLSVRMVERMFDEWKVDLDIIAHPLVHHSPMLLDKAARSSNDKSVLTKIIENPITLNSTIEYLAACGSAAIRNVLIDRPNVSKKALDIVLFMQGKPGTPISLLHELAKSSEYLCLASLTEYPYTPLEVLEKIVISQHPIFLVIQYQIRHSAVFYSPLDSEYICANLVKHPNTSVEILKQISRAIRRKMATSGYRDDKDICGMVRSRLSNQYIVPIATETESKIIGDRYSRENLFENIPDDIPL